MSTIVTRAGKGSALTFAEVDSNFTNLNTDKYQSGSAASLASLTLASALPVLSGGTGVNTSTGSGSVVLSTSPTLVTPLLGTPTSGNFSTGTFTWPTFNQNTTGTAAGLSATLVATSGGTGQSSYAVGDLLYASTTTALSKLADVATGNALISGGVGVAPAWGKIGLTTHVSGTLPVANGGTGTATAFTPGSVLFADASGVYSQNNAQLFWDDTNNRLGIGTATPGVKLDVVGAIRSNTTTYPNYQYNASNRMAFGETSVPPSETGSVVQFGSGLNTRNMVFAFTKTAINTSFFGNTGTQLVIGSEAAASICFRTGLVYAAADILASGTERMRIDSSGYVLAGTSSAITGLVSRFTNAGTDAETFYAAARYVNSQAAPGVRFGKSRGATVGAHAALVSGDRFGEVQMFGSDGTNFVEGGKIWGEVDGAVSLGVMPGRLTFYTTPAGTGTATEKMRIDNAGNVFVNTTGYTVITAAGTVSPRIGAVGPIISVRGAAGGGEARYHLYNQGSAAEWLMGQKSGTAHNFVLSKMASGVELDHLVVTPAGNVGIGTATPGNLLSVQGNANFTGNVTLGDATTDTVTVSGYMSVGGTPTASQGFRVIPSALTGTFQIGSLLSLSATSAATVGVEAARVQAATAAAAFTTNYTAGLWVRDAILGAGSTITNNYGVYVDDKTVGTNNYGLVSVVSSGTNKWNIYASGTADNYFAGSVGIGTPTPTADAPLHIRSVAGGIKRVLMQNAATTAGTQSRYDLVTGTANAYSIMSLAESGTGNVTFELGTGPGVNNGMFFSSGTTSAPIVFRQSTTERMRIDSAGNVGIGTAANLSTLTVNGSFASESPSTVNAATYTVAATDGSLRFTTTNCTVTLPAAASFPGRILYLNTITANSVTSAASNVIPLGSNTAGTAILAATLGKFAMIQSDGTNWITMMAN